MASSFHTRADASAPSSAHAHALELVGFNRSVLALGAGSEALSGALADQHCRVTAGDPERLPELSGAFDVILAIDTLEHLPHPDAVLRDALGLLGPDGRLVVALPHVGHADVRLSLVAGDWEYRGSGLLGNANLRFFTLTSITSLLTEAGLAIGDLRRVRVPVFETELGVQRADVPAELLELVLADPEAETYTFVFAAGADAGENRLGQLTERNAELERELDRLRIEHGAARAARDLIMADNDLLTERARRHELELSSLQHTVRALQAELESTSRLLEQIAQSSSLQLAGHMRARTLELCGGDQTRRARLLQRTFRRASRRFTEPVDLVTAEPVEPSQTELASLRDAAPLGATEPQR
jgi:SAM-dependent methyltransferase